MQLIRILSLGDPRISQAGVESYDNLSFPRLIFQFRAGLRFLAYALPLPWR